MKISIVTAVWNRARTIGEALESVQRQSHRDIEHVIQDGGSTDGTLQVIERLADERTCVVSERDSGIYDAINTGIARATGDVIGLMHSDDIFASDNVLSDVAVALADREVDGVYGDLQYVSATDPDRVIRYWRSGSYGPSALKRGWMPPHPTLYLRREVFERWGAYDTSFRISADYDAMLRWLNNGVRLAYVPRVLVKMRVGGQSNASLGSILRKSLEDYCAIRCNKVGGLGTLALKNFSKIEQFI
ncbi:glycosyltransferase family 2 protein (plasmid) [Limimaricola variabilis]|uniref:glycosyltransferase family 2 protein n=1 Tax=Limimaricola variabilis TaxID=1492771 RepID=UPI002AC9C200|nr:glycosyltransferase family 2 protein [Limimaricola variabilis]WPY96243.1 glycosyltransferase family 2 protein [Limimaricola variabilis]